MSVHIGQKIKEVVHDKGIKVSELAKKINRSRNVVYDIFERSSINTDLLATISQVLGHDFFQYYTISDRVAEEQPPYSLSSIEAQTLQRGGSSCQKELEILKRDLTVKQENLRLLEQKIDHLQSQLSE